MNCIDNILPMEFKTKKGCSIFFINIMLFFVIAFGIILIIFKHFFTGAALIIFAGALLWFSIPAIFTYYVLTVSGIIIKHKYFKKRKEYKWKDFIDADLTDQTDYKVRSYNYKDLGIKEYEHNVFVINLYTEKSILQINQNEIENYTDFEKIVRYKLGKKFRNLT